MKKLVFLLFFALISSHCFSQQTDMYIKTGANISSLDVSPGSSALVSKNAQILFNLAFYSDINYGKFSLQPGIQFSGKGGEYYDNSASTLKKLRLYYIEVPLNIVLNVKAGKNSMFFGGGPYLSGGMGGTLTTVEPTKSAKSNLKLFKKTASFRLGDAGAGAIAGIRFESGWMVSANYELGFANILTDRANTTGDISMKTRTLGLSFGHVF
jgi:hypothetical protein